MEHRDPPRFGLSEGRSHEIVGDGPDDQLPPTRRRFPRLLSPPTLRRWSPGQIALIALMAFFTLLTSLACAFWLIKLGQAYVVSQADYQLFFREIKIDPPLPRWYRGGTEAFLARVEAQSNLPDSFSSLDLDLGEVRKAFEHNPLVKRVVSIDRQYPKRIRVVLEYHLPVAIAKLAEHPDYLVDREANILPRDVINLDMAGPLIELHDFSPPYDPRDGHRWYQLDPKEKTPVPSPAIAEAAQLAAFLRERIMETGPLPGAFYVYIHRNKKSEAGFFVQVGSNLMFRWENRYSGNESAIPNDDVRWAMLLAWAKLHPPLAESPTYHDLGFTMKGIALKATQVKPAPGGAQGPS